ncbi:hypothetical protein [Trinickia dinghuensis]|uniref:RES domain-containing protein n=1 Tax=Trinickia dinghuensis TaxID=2291023 RepID=A0A3D8JZ89_9BURK|nr:hypothetical protein [Trinickia dinghuensis]RDU97934.1 hypothetical protein DWV00_15460 [Trinickia dinghuensis]
MPKQLEESVPSAEKILLALGCRTYTYELDTEFIRASYDAKYVKTASPFKAHRFGPPLEFVKNDGTLEFNWLYMATNALVAVWESQLVVNNRGAGNGYHITRKAIESGVIARIRVNRSLSLWNLGEDHCSRLGIHDIVSSRDHESCQWLGYRIRQAMLSIDARSRPDGFVYPSRRVKGLPALAIADWAVVDLFANAEVVIEPLVHSDIHAYLSADPLLTNPPEVDAPRLVV